MFAGKVSAEEMCFDFKIETCHRWLFWNGIVSLFLLSTSYRALFRLPDVFCPPWWGIWRGDNINVIMKVTTSSLFANTMMIMVMSKGYPDFITLINISEIRNSGKDFFLPCHRALITGNKSEYQGGEGQKWGWKDRQARAIWNWISLVCVTPGHIHPAIPLVHLIRI